jgi:hypothetical protein
MPFKPIRQRAPLRAGVYFIGACIAVMIGAMYVHTVGVLASGGRDAKIEQLERRIDSLEADSYGIWEDLYAQIESEDARIEHAIGRIGYHDTVIDSLDRGLMLYMMKEDMK